MKIAYSEARACVTALRALAARYDQDAARSYGAGRSVGLDKRDYFSKLAQELNERLPKEERV